MRRPPAFYAGGMKRFLLALLLIAAPAAADDTALTLYFRTPVTTSAHDEWTVDGRRWEQVGESAPWPKGTVISLTRRTG